MNGRIDINFIKTGTSQADIDLFLSPVDNGQVTMVYNPFDKLVLAHLMHRANLFSSVSEARRNGWDKPVPTGFSQYVVGQYRALITILNLEVQNES